MRKAFIEGLCRVAETNSRLLLITGDLGYRFLEPFATRYPDQFLNIGVSEATMVSVAAGLATCGYTPFIYSIATFASMRAFEQIRNDIVLQKLNVKIVGIGAGLAYTKAGPTHHSVEDIALMRLLPSMTIINPSDPAEALAATIALTTHTGPAYLRLERNPEEIYQSTSKSYIIGQGVEVEKGEGAVLLFTGTKSGFAQKIKDIVAKKHIKLGIVAMPTIAPLDNTLLLRLAKRYSTWITLEEHGVIGGFGSAITDWVQTGKKTQSVRVHQIGLVAGIFTKTGEYNYLLAQNKMDQTQVANQIVAWVKHG